MLQDRAQQPDPTVSVVLWAPPKMGQSKGEGKDRSPRGALKHMDKLHNFLNTQTLLPGASLCM